MYPAQFRTACFGLAASVVSACSSINAELYPVMLEKVAFRADITRDPRYHQLWGVYRNPAKLLSTRSRLSLSTSTLFYFGLHEKTLRFFLNNFKNFQRRPNGLSLGVWRTSETGQGPLQLCSLIFIVSHAKFYAPCLWLISDNPCPLCLPPN